jgi:DUF1365 family protein
VISGSALFKGTLHHRRTSPKVHDFRYEVAFFYLELSEIEKLFRVPFFFSHRFPRLIGFNRNSYLRGKPSLDETVRDRVESETGVRPEGPIRLLTQISYFGFCFNPVSFYYCFDPDGTTLRHLVAEITNTPWNERKSYVFEVTDPSSAWHSFTFLKDFHVSPFMPMNLENHWRFRTPGTAEGGLLKVRMEDFLLSGGKDRIFEADLILRRESLSTWNLIRTLAGFPLLTIKAFLAIYYQAMLLKLKNIPFHPHPESRGKL